jgi:hypothetical protein
MEKKEEGKKSSSFIQFTKKKILFFSWLILESVYHVVRIRVLQRPKNKIK